jgi:hypothetical protein
VTTIPAHAFVPSLIGLTEATDPCAHPGCPGLRESHDIHRQPRRQPVEDSTRGRYETDQDDELAARRARRGTTDRTWKATT